MQAITIYEARTKFNHYVAAAKSGQTIYIGSYGQPEVVLQRVPKKQPKSWIGAMKGQFHVSPEEWDESDKLLAKDWEVWLDKDI